MITPFSAVFRVDVKLKNDQFNAGFNFRLAPNEPALELSRPLSVCFAKMAQLRLFSVPVMAPMLPLFCLEEPTIT